MSTSTNKGPRIPTLSLTTIRQKREESDNTDELVWDLFDAISDDNQKAVSNLLKESKFPHRLVARKDLQGLTPLKKAITLNRPDVARILVSHGASPSVRDPVGKTPLHIAVMQGRRGLIAPLLVSSDSSVNVQDNAGWTPLHYAIRGKHYNALEWLLYAGADVNIKNKNDESPLDMSEDDALIKKMLRAYNVDRDVYPVILSSAFISRKCLNYIGTDGRLMIVTSMNWSQSEQFFFCKRIRPSQARPLIPLRWNEIISSDVYHYRTMRKLNPGQRRVRLYILFFEQLKLSDIVLKITSKDKYLGEIPLQRSTYIQDKCTNYMGTCELEIKAEGQFAVVKRCVSLQMHKNEDGVLSVAKHPRFLIDLPPAAVPPPPKEWNSGRHERALKERDQLVKATQQIMESMSDIDFMEAFKEQILSEESRNAETVDTKRQVRSIQSITVESVIKLERQETSQAQDKPEDDGSEDMQQNSGLIVGEDTEEVDLEEMMEAFQEDDSDDFYYVSKGWGLYLTVMRAFPFSTTHPPTKDTGPIRCSTDFYCLNHTSDQQPKNDCLVQIPKTEEFTKVGTVLVFVRANIAPEDESPGPDESSQEYLLSEDMKTSWGVYWQNQEKERWSLLHSGIVNKHSRVIFKTRQFSSYIVVQLNTGSQRSEKEEFDDESSDEEEEETPSGEDDAEVEKEEKEGGEEGETASQEPTEGGSKKSKKKGKKQEGGSFMMVLDETICLQEEIDPDEEEKMDAEQGEGEGEDAAEEATMAETAEIEPTVEHADDTGEPGAPAPSPMVNNKEDKDDNASNLSRPWSAPQGNNNNRKDSNNNAEWRRAAEDKNNNQIRDNDETVDQNSLAPEERTIVVGLPPEHASFANLSTSPSVFRPSVRYSVIREDPIESTDTGEEHSSEAPKSSSGPETLSAPKTPGYPEVPEEFISAEDGSISASKTYLQEYESDEDLPEVLARKLSIVVTKNGVKKLQEFKFGPKLNEMVYEDVDMDQVKSEVAQMWRYRNHKQTNILIFSRPRGDHEFEMIVDIVQSNDTYVRAESHHSEGFKMIGESDPVPIKTGKLLSFTIEGPLIVDRCDGGIPGSQGNPKNRTMYIAHSQVNTLLYVVRRPQVEEAKGPPTKKGKKKEEVKVELEPDAKLEVMAFNAGSGTNGVDLTAMPIWLTGNDYWHDRHVQLRASDNILLDLFIECLSKSRAVAKNWWRIIILLGYPEKEVEKEKGRTHPNVIVANYMKRWFEDCLNQYDRGILKLFQVLSTLNLDVAMNNLVRILKMYKAHLLNETVRPRYLKLLFHWVLQTKITLNNLLRLPDPSILRPVSDVFLLHLSDFLPKQHLFKVGAAMEVEENVLHAIAGEEIITDEAYLGFRVLVKSRQKKDEIIHYTLLLMEMFKQVELPEANAFMVRETKKWIETVSDTEPEVCAKLENVFG